MSDMKCPFCQQELRKIHPTYVICDNCRITGEDKLWQELIRTRKELEQSETCCSDWEMQALDYKAENIALSGDLERTRKALDVAKDTLCWYDDNYDSVVARNTLDEIKTITAPEEKDVK